MLTWRGDRWGIASIEVSAVKECTMGVSRIGCGIAVGVWCVLTASGVNGAEPELAGGNLHVVDQDGPSTVVCPLNHTHVEVEISGFVSSVRVRQTFHNP